MGREAVSVRSSQPFGNGAQRRMKSTARQDKLSNRLELEAHHMEEQLVQLRKQAIEDKQKLMKERPLKHNGNRWRSAREDRGTMRKYGQDVQTKSNDKKRGNKLTKKDAVGHRNGYEDIISTGSIEKWSTSDVLTWLASIGMSEYESAFEFHQVTGNMLLKMQLEDYKSIGVVKLSARNTLYHAINKFRPASNQSESDPVDIVDPMLTTVAPSSLSTTGSVGKIHWSHVAPLKDTTNDSAVLNSTVNLADGEFDEAESHASFMKALLEWRGDEAESKASESKPEQNGGEDVWTLPVHPVETGTSFNTDKVNSEKGGKLLNGQYDEDKAHEEFKFAVQLWRENVARNAVIDDNVVQQSDHSMTTEARKSCWECYKVFAENELELDDHTGKSFCSKECQNVFLQNYARLYANDPAHAD